MKKNVLYLIGFCILSLAIQTQHVKGQTENSIITESYLQDSGPTFDLGMGLGCDYSGLGFKLSYLPVPSFSTFVSAGFAFVDIGWNIGVSYHFVSKLKPRAITPHIKVMYGYNEIVWLPKNKSYNSLYYGCTAGIGVEYRFGRNKKHRIDFDLNLPFRSQEFKDEYEMMKNNPNVEPKKPLPLAFAIGYHITIFQKTR